MRGPLKRLPCLLNQARLMTTHMKILFVITKSNWGGAQRYVFDLAQAHHKQGHSVVVAFGGTGKRGAATGRLHEKLTAEGIRTVHLSDMERSVALIKEVKVFWSIRALLKKEHPDVIHVVSSKAGGLGALAARVTGVRCVFSVLGFAFKEDRHYLTRGLIRFFSWLTILLAHHTICTTRSDFETAHAFLFVNPSQLSLIYNCIQPEAPLSRATAQEALLTPHNLTLAPETIWLATGTELHPNKGIDLLLTACAQLPSSNSYHLFIIGGGVEEENLQSQVEQLGLSDRITFLGFVEGLAQKLSAFDVFVLPSRKEGMPYIVHEIAQAGVAFVGTRVGAIPDVITHNETGLLVESGDVPALHAAVQQLLSDQSLRSRLSNALHEQLQTRFAFETFIESVEATYNTSVSKAP